VRRRWQEKQYQSPYPDELAETGCGLEASVPRVNQALIARIRPSRSGKLVAEISTSRSPRRTFSRTAYGAPASFATADTHCPLSLSRPITNGFGTCALIHCEISGAA